MEKELFYNKKVAGVQVSIKVLFKNLPGTIPASVKSINDSIIKF